MPFNPALADRIRAVVPSLALLEGEKLGETKMFGGLCFTLNGKMLVGIERDRLVVRISDEDYSREFQAGRVAPMDFTGRPLRNFAYLVEGTFDKASDVLFWAETSASFVRKHMLAKTPKKRSTSKST
ncbi:MAG: TfoX/Sxy family protein [Armatimonadetes bacterium]|nr:TfoX/Sxy family protein [Armatimonadota bacterium]